MEYQSTEILNDNKAFSDQDYANAKYQEAENTIKKMGCLKLDILAKDIIHFFNNSELFESDNTVLTSFALSETDEGYPYWANVTMTNDQGELFELSSDDEVFFQNISNELGGAINLYSLDNFQKDQGFLFKVNKNSIHQDVQSTMNKIINMVEPSYLINKENHMLQEQTTTPQQSKQKPHL